VNLPSSLGRGAYIERELIGSKAFQKLTKAEMNIYFVFLLKRKFGKRKGKAGTGPNKIITNNGEITFSYAEAEKYGFPRPTFRRAIDKLIEVGLIDLTHQGEGGCVGPDGKVRGECSLYAINERWEDYGTDDFKKQVRKKDKRKGRGWAVYHARKNKSK
jgi:hypothetical protein